jgi:integrase
MNKAKIQEALRRASRPELAEALRVAEAKCDALERELFPELFSGEQIAASQSSKALSTGEVVIDFLKSITVAETSKESYRSRCNVFAKHYPIFPSTPEEIEQYFHRTDKRTGKEISERTAAGDYAILKMVYEFANQRRGFPNVMEKVRRPSFKEKEPYSLTLDEARAVVNACRDDRELGLIHLYLGHGWRLEEACRANVGHIGDGQILVKGKKRQEYMPLLTETREILLRLYHERNPGEPLFVSQHHKRLSHKQTYNVVKDVMTRAGVIQGKDPSERIATHTLRKTFATLALEADCDSRMIDRLLRHRKRNVGDLYMRITMDMLRQTLERYSPIRLLNGQPKEELHKIFSCSKNNPLLAIR